MKHAVFTFLLILIGTAVAFAGSSSERVGLIQGVVVRPDGSAIKDVRVVARRSRGRGTWDDPYSATEPRTPLPRPEAESRTQDDGTFALSGLDPTAWYEVAIEDPTVAAAPRFTARADPFRSLPRDVRLVLPDGGPVRGSLQGVPSGARAWVTLRRTLDGGYPSAGSNWRTGWIATDVRGSFQAAGVPQGVVAILANVSGQGTWAGYTVVGPGAELVLALDRMSRLPDGDAPRIDDSEPHAPPEAPVAYGRITGVVRDERGAPAPGVVVRAQHSRPTPVELPQTVDSVRYVAADAAGRYGFSQVPIGTRWLLEASTRGAMTSLMDRVDVVVPKGETLPVDVRVTHFRQLRCRVVLEDGSGVAGVEVNAVAWSSDRAPPPIYAIAVDRAMTDAGGAFTIAARGNRLQIVDPTLVQLDAGALAPHFDTGKPVDNVTLRVRRVPPAVWSGLVRGTDGRPQPWRQVSIQPKALRTDDLPLLSGAAVGITDAAGRFRIETDSASGARLSLAIHRAWVDGEIVGEVPFGGAPDVELLLRAR